MSIIDPTYIPGLLAWYSAEYEATNYADGDPMTGWTDLSGNGNHCTIGTTSGGPGPALVWEATTGPAGGPAIKSGTTGSTPSQYFLLPDAIFSGVTTAAEAAAHCISPGSGTPGLWRFSDSSWANAPSIHGVGTCWEGFMMNFFAQNYTAPASITNWHRYDVISKNLDQRCYFNGALEASSTSGDRVFDPPTTQISFFRASNTPGSANTYHYGGRATTLVVYGRELTPTERADLDAWMVAHPSGGLPLAPPEDPVSLTITDVTSTTLGFSWATGGGVVDGYEVRIDSGTPVDVGLSTDHLFEDLDPSTVHVLEVRAYNDAGSSGWSAIAAETDPPPPTATVTLNACLEGLCGLTTVTFTVTSDDPLTVTPGATGGGDTTTGTPVEHPGGGVTVEASLFMLVTPGFPDCWQPQVTFSEFLEASPIEWSGAVTQQPGLTPEQQVSGVRRRFDGVVVVDGPKELDRVTVAGNVFSTVEWTMVATDPYMYRDPRHVWQGVTGAAPVFLDAGVTLLASNPAFVDIDCPAPSSSITTCADDPSCPPLLSPPAAPVVLGCDPVVTTWDRQWVEIPAAVVGSSESVLTAVLTNSTGFAQTARIRLYLASDFTTECAFTQELWVDYIPPGSTVVIDEGGQVLIECGGEFVNATRNVRGTYRGPYSPLVLGCTVDWVAAFDVAGANTTAEWDVSLVQRNG